LLLVVQVNAYLIWERVSLPVDCRRSRSQSASRGGRVLLPPSRDEAARSGEVPSRFRGGCERGIL